MGTAILLPRDALSLTASRRNPNPNKTRWRKRSPVAVDANFHDNQDRSRCDSDRSVVVAKGPGANLVMGQVKILKRGEKLSVEDERPKQKEKEEGFDLALCSTDRLGPDPEIVKRQIRVPDLKAGMYAGSAFMESPPPSSVPVPIFLGKSRGAATADLRRLLRLDSV